MHAIDSLRSWRFCWGARASGEAAKTSGKAARGVSLVPTPLAALPLVFEASQLVRYAIEGRSSITIITKGQQKQRKRQQRYLTEIVLNVQKHIKTALIFLYFRGQQKTPAGGGHGGVNHTVRSLVQNTRKNFTRGIVNDSRKNYAMA